MASDQKLNTSGNDEEEKTIPPLYICIHRNAPNLCDLWDQHPRGSTAFKGIEQSGRDEMQPFEK